MKVFTAVALVAALSVGGLTLALASDQDVEDVEEEEDAEAVDISALKAVDPETGQEIKVLVEEDSEPDADESESEPASSEKESSDQDSGGASASESQSKPAASGTQSQPAASATKEEPAASETKAEPAASETKEEPEEEEISETEDEEVPETPEPEDNEPEEQNVEENTETVTGTITDVVEPVETISAEEILASSKEGIYVALRNAGMAHVGAVSVMGVMDATSELDDLDGSLFGWTDEWKDALDEYAGDNASSQAYQVAFLLESLENPEEVIEIEEDEEINFDYLKAALMSDDSYVMTDVWYFTQYYLNKVNPDNEVDINDCLRLAREYEKEYESIKDSYEDLPTVFDVTTVSASGQSVAEFACSFVGNPYVWGGTSLTNGCDCSGFIMSVYAHYGVSLPHYSGSLRSVGYEVSPSEMQPGDIVCYSGHCAIYIGDGRIVHASNSQPYPVGGIKISPDYAYRPVLAIRRVAVPDTTDDADVAEIVDTIDIEPAVLTQPEKEFEIKQIEV